MSEKPPELSLYCIHVQLNYPDTAPEIVRMIDQYIDEDWIDYTQAIMMLKAILDPEPDD